MIQLVSQQKLTLKSHHKQEWLESKVDEEIISLNVQSLSGNNAYASLLYGLDKSARRNDGRLTDRWLRDYNHLNDGGWWCSGVDLLNNFEDSEWGCFKPDNPRSNWQSNKPIKYEHPVKVPTELFALKVPERIWEKIAEYWGVEKKGNSFWQWVINNKEVPLVITEGAKKAGSLLSLGFPAVALPGINNGARNQKDSDGEDVRDPKKGLLADLIPQLKIFTEGRREIIFAFDCDHKKKTGNAVEKATSKLGYLFEEAKCTVSVVEWKYTLGKGIDDLIVFKGDNWVSAMIENRKSFKEWKFERKQSARRLNDLETADFIHDEFFVDGRLSFNEMSGKIHLDGELWDIPEALNIYFHQEYNISASSDHIADALNYYGKQNSFNPVKSYLERVRNEEPRISIDNLSSRYFGTTSKLDNVKVKKSLISAVARAMRPGCKCDTMLVLQGEQGIGKSTFFETLASSEFFGDSIEDVKGKETYLLLNTAWIQELGEIEKITTGKEVGDIKKFLDRKTDTYRELYEKRATEHPRHSIFVGSVNDAQFLRDKTGNRRFWIIKVLVDSINYELLAKERDAIWATAYDAYLAGEKWWFNAEDEKQNRLDNFFFEQHDEWETLIENYLESRTIVSVGELMSEVLHIEVKEYPRNSNKVATLLSKLGWFKSGQKLHRGQKTVVWERQSTLSRGIDENLGGVDGGVLTGVLTSIEASDSKEYSDPVNRSTPNHSKKSGGGVDGKKTTIYKIGDSVPEIKVGDKVTHPVNGIGTVKEINGLTDVKVLFDNCVMHLDFT